MKAFIFLTFSATFFTVVLCGAEPIPGTNLLTRTFYKISNKAFPGAVVTYTALKGTLDGYHYGQIDNNPDHLSAYYQEGKWFPDAQWEFIPVPSAGDSQWYRMTNRAEPTEYLTWSDTEFVEGPGQTNYIVLDSNLNGIRSSHDFLVKPVRADAPDDGYYKLKFKGLPKAVVTHSLRVYGGMNQRYLMVDNSRNETIKNKYEPGQPKHSSVLFGFEMPVLNDYPLDLYF